METFQIDGITYKRSDIETDGDIVTVIKEGQWDLKVGQKGKRIMGWDRVEIEDTQYGQYIYSPAIFATLVPLTPEEKEIQDKDMAEMKAEFQTFVTDFVDLCNDYKLSKEAVIEMMDIIYDALLETMRKSKKMSPEKEIIFKKMRVDMLKELENKTFGDGQFDGFVLLMVKKLLKNRLNPKV